MDFRFDGRRDERSHENGDDDDVLLSVLPLLWLMSMLLLPPSSLMGVDALVVEGEDEGEDDDDDMLPFPELSVVCLRLDNFHLPRLMMTTWVLDYSIGS